MPSLKGNLLKTLPFNSHRSQNQAVIIVLVIALVASGQAAGSTPGNNQRLCEALIRNGPLHVTQSCIDPEFSKPVIDSVLTVTRPLALHKVSGHFEGTSVTFNFYYPPKGQWRGRFFHKTYPFTDGLANEQDLAFASKSGAYTVRTGHSSGYRGDAAAAKFSRQVAREYYDLGAQHIFGYVYGGSGGSYQTIAAIENSDGVWDGAVPYVMGTPTSIPNNFFVRAFARIVLLNKADKIADAMNPGGSGDPYEALDPTQVSALREVTAMGLPLGGWTDPQYLLGLGDSKGLMGFRDVVKQSDPEYVSAFWSQPGYLGTEQSALGDLFRAALVDSTTEFTRDELNPSVLRLEHVPERGYPPEWEFTLLDAQQQSIGAVTGNYDARNKTFTLDQGQKLGSPAFSKKAGKLRIDNRWALALAAYHRYQIPHEPGIKVWDQFLDAEGLPKFPQRPEIGPAIAQGASGGGVFSGQYSGKMILIGNLLDVDAFPWDSDWYAARAKAQQGEDFSDRFRVWFNQNADHHDGSVIVSGKTETHQIRLISYVGILQQALRDISDWVERGVEPSPSTNYKVVDGQVSVEAQPRDRHGIQPAVELTVDGKTQAAARTDEPLRFEGKAQTPAGAGSVTKVELSSDGEDHFVSVPFSAGGDTSVTVGKTLSFDKPGIYFPVLRVSSSRDGSGDEHVAVVQNLARVRVIVRDR